MIWKDRSDEYEIEAAMKKMRSDVEASESRISKDRSPCTGETFVTCVDEVEKEIDFNENTICDNFVDI